LLPPQKLESDHDMLTYKRTTGIWLSFLLLSGLIPVSSHAMVGDTDSLSLVSPGDQTALVSTRDSVLVSDSLFQEARDLAFISKNNPEAILVCQQALALNPVNSDFRVFLGRLYAWEGHYDTAAVHLIQVLDKNPEYEDARNALANVYIWGKNFDQALELLDAGLKQNPVNTDFLYKKALCLNSMNKPESARKVLKKLLKIDANHAEAAILLKNLPDPDPQRKISIAYSYDRLADTKTQWQMLVDEASLDPWQLLTLEAEQKFSFGPVIARLNLANRFELTGTQIEIEAYPNIRRGTYSYLSIGYSGSSIFPIYRLGAELFQDLPQAFEASLGFRFLHLEATDVSVITASTGKYIGNYWVNVRAFISPQDVSFSKAWNFQSRRYLKDADTFLEVNLGSGESIGTGLGSEEINYLGSRHIAFQYQRKLNEMNLVRVGLSLGNVEVRKDNFRGDTGLFMNYSYRF